MGSNLLKVSLSAGKGPVTVGRFTKNFKWMASEDRIIQEKNKKAERDPF